MSPPPVLFVQHVAWERPHRLGKLLAGKLPTVSRTPLEGDSLPPPETLAAAVFMGGPMSVDDTKAYPGLLEELRWLERAHALNLPLIGICLGSQLLARALGAPVTKGAHTELGWRPVEVMAPDDSVLGALAPVTLVLHWHSDSYPTPPGARCLARSQLTSCQAFRSGNAWGILFHPEADYALAELWVAEPTMAREAQAALGPNGPDTVLADARQYEQELKARSETGFQAFGQLAEKRSIAQSS